MKTPDYAYLPKDSPYPSVVFEVGWTEDPDDLFSDAEQWLVKTGGQVQLVITVRFIEDNSPLAERRRELKNIIWEGHERFITKIADHPGLEVSRKAVEEWIGWGKYWAAPQEEGDGAVEDSNSDGALSPAPSTVSDHILEKQQIDPNRWVGQISAKVNFFRYNKATGQMYKDGEEYVLAPDGTVSPNDAPLPRLSMRDVWGAGVEKKNKEDAGVAMVGVEKEKEKDIGAATACVWDWKALKGYVESAKRDYAFNRKKDLVNSLCGD